MLLKNSRKPKALDIFQTYLLQRSELFATRREKQADKRATGGYMMTLHFRTIIPNSKSVIFSKISFAKEQSLVYDKLNIIVGRMER